MGSVVWQLCGCELGGVGARESDDVLIAKESAGFRASDEEDVRTAPET